MKDISVQVGVVVIGRNEGKRLTKCLHSILEQTKKVVYVDSGSTDDSCLIAENFGVEILKLNMLIPFSAASARNEGFAELTKKFADIQFVQFVDGDCELFENWIQEAFNFLQNHPDYAAVKGRIIETDKSKNIYHRIANVEWISASTYGEVEVFGGIVMIRVNYFKKVNGFNTKIIAGEDDELSLRIKRIGGRIFCLDCNCALHDIKMDGLKQWWMRSKRTGHAFAQLSYLYGKSPEKKIY